MKATRNRRTPNPHPHADYADAVSVTRFWKLVHQGDEDACWDWQGDTDQNGYGVFHYRGRLVGAHELALSFTLGEKRLQGLDTCHSCDRPRCCNPGHLRFASRRSNVDDMVSRGRHRHGETHHHAVLTSAEVREMRERRANGALQRDLADDYGVSAAYVSDIVNGLCWQEAGGPITGRSKRTSRRQSNRKAA